MALASDGGFDYAGIRERAERWLRERKADVRALELPGSEEFAALAMGG